jgi:hypothetical protein
MDRERASKADDNERGERIETRQLKFRILRQRCAGSRTFAVPTAILWMHQQYEHGLEVYVAFRESTLSFAAYNMNKNVLAPSLYVIRGDTTCVDHHSPQIRNSMQQSFDDDERPQRNFFLSRGAMRGVAYTCF